MLRPYQVNHLQHLRNPTSLCRASIPITRRCAAPKDALFTTPHSITPNAYFASTFLYPRFTRRLEKCVDPNVCAYSSYVGTHRSLGLFYLACATFSPSITTMVDRPFPSTPPHKRFPYPASDNSLSASPSPECSCFEPSVVLSSGIVGYRVLPLDGGTVGGS